MHRLENHNPISFKVKCSRHSCVSVSKQCACDVNVYQPFYWEPDKMLWPATSKSISTKSHLVILAAPTGQGGRGAFDCVRGHLQSIAGSHSASGCPFTACGPRRMDHFVSRAPPPPAPSILYSPQVLPPLLFGSFIPFSLPWPPPHRPSLAGPSPVIPCVHVFLSPRCPPYPCVLSLLILPEQRPHLLHPPVCL